jgi:hypothetical protein
MGTHENTKTIKPHQEFRNSPTGASRECRSAERNWLRIPSSSTVTVGCQSLVPPRGDKETGGVVLGRSLPTWLTVTEAPTVAVVCLTYNRVHMKGILKRKITNKNA